MFVTLSLHHLCLAQHPLIKQQPKKGISTSKKTVQRPHQEINELTLRVLFLPSSLPPVWRKRGGKLGQRSGIFHILQRIPIRQLMDKKHTAHQP